MLKCVCVCVCACVRACVRVGVGVGVRVCVCVSKWRKGGQSKGEKSEENSTRSDARCRTVL